MLAEGPALLLSLISTLEEHLADLPEGDVRGLHFGVFLAVARGSSTVRAAADSHL